jgi:hypothetical protein
VTRANDPIRTATPEAGIADELAESTSQQPGVQLFILANLGYLGPDYDVSTHANHRMQVKGFLVKQPGNYRINVTSLEMISDTCPQ